MENPPLSKRLTARSLEIQAGRVHEHEVKLAEQIAPAREQFLFDDVLQAARCEQRGAVLLIFAQFFAQPGHRPIKVMQVEMLNAIDGVILAPAVGRPIGAAGEQAMQNGEKHRAFERKAVLAGTGDVFNHLAAASLFPQSLEDKGGPDPPRRIRRDGPLGDGVDDDGFRGKARARPKQPLQLTAVAQILDAAERGDHLLAHLRAVAAAFDDLEVSAAARGLLAEIHARNRPANSFVVRT